jgi:hypothetical protein
MDSLHIPIAVTYNGSKRETSGREWTEKAIEHFRTVEDQLNIHPKIAVIQSWNPFPDKMIPEADPEALSFVLREYIRAHDRDRTEP